MSYTGIYFSPNEAHGFYHSWGPVADAIQTSKFNHSDFTFLEPDDLWPKDLDLITSFGSWCWHYDLETYWRKAKESLKIGGKIYLEISNNVLQYKDVMKIISTEFETVPRVAKILQKNDRVNKLKGDVLVDNSGVGYRCCWIRRK